MVMVGSSPELYPARRSARNRPPRPAPVTFPLRNFSARPHVQWVPTPPAGPRLRNPTRPRPPPPDLPTMRLLLSLTTLACLSPVATAAKTDEARERERLEKA